MDSGPHMNWKAITLGVVAGRLALLGAAAGVWAAFLHDSVRLLLALAGLGGYWHALAGAVLGGALGAVLGAADEVLHRYRRRSVEGALIGGVGGLLVGGVGSALLVALGAPAVGGAAPLDTAAPGALAAMIPVLGATVGWLAVLGAVVGLAAGMASHSRRRAGRRVAVGAGVGLVLGVPVAGGWQLLPENAWALLVLLAAWGAGLAEALFWWEKRAARRWLRLLTGPGEDTIFPLHPGAVTLGKNERNDIPLLHYREVYPFHCELSWVDDHYEVYDAEQGGLVLINFRQAQDQALKPGDLVKIGTALLQYDEGARP